VLKKPDFFFGDAITEKDRVLYDGDYKWLRQIGDMRFFSHMERMYPLAYLQYTSVNRAIEWDLSKPISGVSLGKLGIKDAYPAGHGKNIFGTSQIGQGRVSDRRNPSVGHHLYQSIPEGEG